MFSPGRGGCLVLDRARSGPPDVAGNMERGKCGRREYCAASTQVFMGNRGYRCRSENDSDRSLYPFGRAYSWLCSLGRSILCLGGSIDSGIAMAFGNMAYTE
jgi:hypothetical protein